jgi:hypothetical protein
MDHGAVITTTTGHGIRRLAMLLMTGALLLALAPQAAHAADATATQPAAPPAAVTTTTGATLIEPADGAHLDHLDLAPMLQIEPSKDAAGTDETPKWILLATDREMKTTVRYCRQFVWATSGGAYHWGCNKWATGVDAYGRDQLAPLEAGTVYYWQAVSSTADGKGEITSAVRSFAIDPDKDPQSIESITNHIVGTAYDDGSNLNLGAAALVNSGVRVKSIASTRLATFAFRIKLSHVGSADYSRSYVRIKSAVGTRYLKVARAKDGNVIALWRLSPAERRLRTKRFTYQAFLKSRKNGAMVRSQARVVLIRSAPKWTPDRRR